MTTAVWASLVGQGKAAEVFTRAVDGAMTHAWLITGPPGSGRSTAAIAFAAALQCEYGGCGDCKNCQMVLDGTHADVTRIDTEGLSIGVKVAREVVRRAALYPSVGSWQIIIIEDADRLTDQAANALLKSIEEPAPNTVWLLCAPFAEDVLVTIRSRCRHVVLGTPSANDVIHFLASEENVDAETARVIAASSQGHIGRARALARNEQARVRRAEIVRLPMGLRDLGSAMTAAKQIVDEAQSRADTLCDELDATELANLQTSWGVEERGKRPVGYAGALSALTKEQKSRRKRMALDEIDRVLIELMAVLRDVLMLQLGASSDLINPDIADDMEVMAARSTPSNTLESTYAIAQCREALNANAAPQSALESMFLRMIS